MANSQSNLNSAYLKNFVNHSVMAYITKFQNSLVPSISGGAFEHSVPGCLFNLSLCFHLIVRVVEALPGE